MGETSVKLSRLHNEFILKIRSACCRAILIVSAYTVHIMNNVWKHISLSPNDFRSQRVGMNQAPPNKYDLPRDCALPINMC